MQRNMAHIFLLKNKKFFLYLKVHQKWLTWKTSKIVWESIEQGFKLFKKAYALNNRLSKSIILINETTNQTSVGQEPYILIKYNILPAGYVTLLKKKGLKLCLYFVTPKCRQYEKGIFEQKWITLWKEMKNRGPNSLLKNMLH